MDINCLSLSSIGHVIFAFSALLSTSDTVVLPQLQAWPISLRDNPISYLSLKISLAFIISSLLIDWPPLIILIKEYLYFSKSTRCPDVPLRCPDNSEMLFACSRNQCPDVPERCKGGEN